MEVLRNKRYLGLAGIILLVLGVFFPYYTWSIWGITGKISLIGYWEGYVILVAAVASALFIFKDYVEQYIPNAFNNGLLGKIKTANPKLILVPVGVSALVAIYLTTAVNVDSSYIKWGLGFWITWLGIAALVAHVFLYKGETGFTRSAPASTPAPAPTPEPSEPVLETTPEPVQETPSDTNSTDDTNNSQM